MFSPATSATKDCDKNGADDAGKCGPNKKPFLYRKGCFYLLHLQQMSVTKNGADVADNNSPINIY